MKLTIDSQRGEQFTLSGRVVRGTAVAAADVLAGGTTIPLDSIAGYPSAGVVMPGGAIVSYTGISGSNLTGVTGAPAIPAGSSVPFAVDLTGATLNFLAGINAQAAIVSKNSGASGGIVIDLSAPAKNAYTITILPGDTNGLAKATEWSWELRLTEASGAVTVVAKGGWRVGVGPT